MISFRSMSLPMFALVTALAGCSAESGTSGGAESVGDVRSTLVAEESAKADSNAKVRDFGRAHHGHGGPGFLLSAALREPINLTAAQKTTIEGLLAAGAPGNGPPKHAFAKADAAALAAAIRTNSVANIAPPGGAGPTDAERAEHRAAEATALAKLHDTLTAEQRALLVDAIEKRGQEHAMREGKGEPGKDGARGPGGHGPGTHGPGAHGPLGLVAGLDLTDAQKEAIKAKLDAARPAPPSAEQREAMKASFEAMRTEMKAKLASFKADAFDATAFVTPSKALTPPPNAMNRPNELAIITSVLTPAQRETLATKIEQGPPAMPARGASVTK